MVGALDENKVSEEYENIFKNRSQSNPACQRWQDHDLDLVDWSLKGQHCGGGGGLAHQGLHLGAHLLHLGQLHLAAHLHRINTLLSPRSQAAVLGGHLCALILGTSARAVAMTSIGCAALAIDRAIVVVTAGGCGRVVAAHLGRSLRRRALVLRRDGRREENGLEYSSLLALVVGLVGGALVDVLGLALL